MWQVDVNLMVTSVSAKLTNSKNEIIRQGTLTVTDSSLRKGDQTLVIPEGAGGQMQFVFVLDGETLSIDQGPTGGGVVILRRGTIPPTSPTPEPTKSSSSSSTFILIIVSFSVVAIVFAAIAISIALRKKKQAAEAAIQPSDVSL